jgi:hypothetical protein
LPLSTGRRASASVSKEGDTVKENPDYLDREECARMFDAGYRPGAVTPSTVGSPDHSTFSHVAREDEEIIRRAAERARRKGNVDDEMLKQ